MAFRGTESPMDFEWQGHGPVDPSSPFHKHIMEAQARKRTAALDHPNKSSSMLKSPGTHNEFNSPKKANFPSLREPNNQPFFFSNTPTSPPPASPFRTTSFTTPRKPFDIDFSSGPENSSPLGPTDNDETPDAKPNPIEFKSNPSKTESKRNSLFGFYGRFAPSPGRGEIRKPHSDAIARRIHKKRRRAQAFDKQLVFGKRSDSMEDDSDDDQLPSPTDPKQQPPVQEVGWMTGLFTFIHTYPDAPSIIAKYLQVFFNAAILGGCLYMFWSFYATIRADVDRASEDAMAEVLAEMATCSKNYIDNRCAADTRLPALESVCSNWELCMNRDPSAVKRARLSAHTFAEIFNSFVEPISLKTMLFTITLVIVGLVVNNATFTLYRRQQENYYVNPAFRPASASYMQSPNHPSGFGAISQGGPGGYGQHQQQPYMGWHDGEAGQHQIEYQRSPSKGHGQHRARSRSRSPEKKRVHS